MQRPRKVPLRHFFRDRGYTRLEVWCLSMKCAGTYSSTIPIAELIQERGITEDMRLDEIEARLRCTRCGARGEVDLRGDELACAPAYGSGVRSRPPRGESVRERIERPRA